MNQRCGVSRCLRYACLGVQQPTRALSLLAFVQGQSHDSDTLAETARFLTLARAATPLTAAETEAQGGAWALEQAVTAALLGE